MTFTKIDPADLDSPCQELSNGGLKSVATLLVCWQIIFCRLVLDVQSSCNVDCHRTVRLSIRWLAGTWSLPLEEGRISERHEDAVPAGSKTNVALGLALPPTACLNGLEGAELVSWPLHSLPDA